jgi:hypothetical protein
VRGQFSGELAPYQGVSLGWYDVVPFSKIGCLERTFGPAVGYEPNCTALQTPLLSHFIL